MRSYGDACGIAHALDLIGERWAALVVRELLFGPKRYTDLRRSLPAASPNIVSQRLDELEVAGVVHRRRLAPPASSWVYELTPYGRELEPVLVALGRWALRAPSFDGTGTLSVVSAVLTLRTYFDPAKHPGWRARFELRFGDERFAVSVADGTLTVVRAADEVPAPDAVIATDARTFVDALGTHRSLERAIAAHGLSVDGDRGAVRRLFSSVTFT
jgi:DNA-binding HxlR family transcriptional regulator